MACNTKPHLLFGGFHPLRSQASRKGEVSIHIRQVKTRQHRCINLLVLTGGKLSADALNGLQIHGTQRLDLGLQFLLNGSLFLGREFRICAIHNMSFNDISPQSIRVFSVHRWKHDTKITCTHDDLQRLRYCYSKVLCHQVFDKTPSSHGFLEPGNVLHGRSARRKKRRSPQ